MVASTIRRIVCALVAAGATACYDSSDRGSQIAPAASRSAGQVLYLTYCESCHGATGTGDGPAAGSLRVPPPDLTRLWVRYGTPLHRDRLAQYIDGRLLFGFHGEREMPIWGEQFFEEAPPNTPNIEATRRRLFEVLVDYLETLQTEQRA